MIKYKAGDARKYKGLNMSPIVRYTLDKAPLFFASNCNGVGSPTDSWYSKLLYPLTPNWIMFEDVTPFSDIHDNEYTVPFVFDDMEEAMRHKAAADKMGYDNLIILCRRMYERDLEKWWMPKAIARARKFAFVKWARTYRWILSENGREVFLKDKTLMG